MVGCLAAPSITAAVCGSFVALDRRFWEAIERVIGGRAFGIPPAETSRDEH